MKIWVRVEARRVSRPPKIGLLADSAKQVRQHAAHPRRDLDRPVSVAHAAMKVQRPGVVGPGDDSRARPQPGDSAGCR